MQNWSISLSKLHVEHFSAQNHVLACVDDFMSVPDSAIDEACLQNFAQISPQYPGIRAAVPKSVASLWLAELSELLNNTFEKAENGWECQAWFSLVTTKSNQLIPMQRFPHVDGTDPRQLAMMLYLNHTEHGGTGFFRHKATGFEALTDANFVQYRSALEDDVRRTGIPDSAYVSDGAPHFERIHASAGAFNQAVFYRGNLLHSGLIDNRAELSQDPAKGRLTINAFFRPAA